MSIVLATAVCVIAAVLWSKFGPTVKKLWHLYDVGNRIPGPPGIPLLGNATQIRTNDYEVGDYFVNMMNKFYGKGEKVVRLWFAHMLNVYPLDGKTVKDIIDSSEEIDKGSDYDVIQPWLGDGLLLSTGEKWKSRRRMLTPTFHFAMLDGYVSSMDQHARIMTELLEARSQSSEPYDLFPMIKKCTLDIICDTAMGYELNSMVKEDHPYALAVGDMGVKTAEYSKQPWLWSYYIRKVLGWQDEYERTVHVLKDFTEHVIQDRIWTRDLEGSYSETNRKAFLDMLLDMKESQSLSIEDIREQVDTFMFAGHDTTSTVVGWTVWALATHPEVQDKLAEEILRVAGSSGEVTLKEIKEMPYLDIVLKESMRVNAPVPLVGRHLRNDLKLGNYVAPAGSNVYISPMMIHRNPELYPDPLRFDPDRFLPENSKQRHAYDFIPFSAGPRNCIGQKFAVYEAKVLMTWLIRKFKFSAKLAFLDNIGCPEIVSRPHLGIPVVIQRRD